MSTFGLVHGAYHGAWCWDLLVPELEARGHRAVAMDLPIYDPAAGALRYAQTVARALDGAGEDVVIVGHSLGGLTIPVVADLRPVRRLVYLCALLPRPGSSFDESAAHQPLFDHYTPSAGPVGNPDGSASCPAAYALDAYYHDCPPEVASWAAARLRPQHWRVTQEVTPLSGWPQVPSSYVVCADDRTLNPAWSRSAALAILSMEPIEMEGGHSPFLSRPAVLADALAGLSS